MSDLPSHSAERGKEGKIGVEEACWEEKEGGGREKLWEESGRGGREKPCVEVRSEIWTRWRDWRGVSGRGHMVKGWG